MASSFLNQTNLLGLLRPIYLLSRELAYPLPFGTFENDCPFHQVGYVSSLEGKYWILQIISQQIVFGSRVSSLLFRRFDDGKLYEVKMSCFIMYGYSANIYIYTYIYIYIWLYVYIYIYINLCVYIYTYIQETCTFQYVPIMSSYLLRCL